MTISKAIQPTPKEHPNFNRDDFPLDKILEFKESVKLYANRSFDEVSNLTGVEAAVMHARICKEYFFLRCSLTKTCPYLPNRSEASDPPEPEPPVTKKEISYFLPPITNTRPSQVATLEQVFNIITRNEKLSQATFKAKALFVEYLNTGNKKPYTKFKDTSFPFVSFSGLFCQIGSKHLQTYSSLMCFDIDPASPINNLPTKEQTENLKKLLFKDEVLKPSLAFISPSGYGIKLVINTNIGKEQHVEIYQRIVNYLNITYKSQLQDRFDIDVKCKNIARVCYLSFDQKALFSNPQNKN